MCRKHSYFTPRLITPITAKNQNILWEAKFYHSVLVGNFQIIFRLSVHEQKVHQLREKMFFYINKNFPV